MGNHFVFLGSIRILSAAPAVVRGCCFLLVCLQLQLHPQLQEHSALFATARLQRLQRVGPEGYSVLPVLNDNARQIAEQGASSPTSAAGASASPGGASAHTQSRSWMRLISPAAGASSQTSNGSQQLVLPPQLDERRAFTSSSTASVHRWQPDPSPPVPVAARGPRAMPFAALLDGNTASPLWRRASAASAAKPVATAPPPSVGAAPAHQAVSAHSMGSIATEAWSEQGSGTPERLAGRGRSTVRLLPAQQRVRGSPVGATASASGSNVFSTSVTSAGSSGAIVSSAQRTPGPLQQEQDFTSRVARSSTAAPRVAPTSSRVDAGTQVRQPEHTRTSGIEWEREAGIYPDGDPGDALVISNIAQELQQSENASSVLGGDDGQPVVPLSPNSVLREQWDPEAGVPLRYRRYRNPQPLLDYLSVQTLVDLVTDFNRRLGFISFLIDPPPAPLRMSTVLDALSGGGEVPREELLRQMRDYAQRVLSAGEDLLMERATSSLAPAARLRLSEDLQAQVLTLRQLLAALEGVQALSPISERSPEGSPPSIAGAAPAASAATRRDAGVQTPTSASAAGSANNSPFDALAPPRPVGLAAVERVPPGELMSRGVPSAQLPRLSQDGRGRDPPAAATAATPGGGQAAQVGRSSVTFLESGAERGSDTSSSSNDDNLEPLERNELMRLLGNFYDAPRGLDGPMRTMAAAQTAMIDLNANAPPFTRQTPEFPTWQLVDGGVSAQMTEQQQREVQARNNAFMDTVLRLQQEQRGPCVPGLLTLAKGVRSLVLKRRKRLAARRSLERRRSGEGEEACRWWSPPRAASPSGLGALRSASAATTRWPTPSARHTGEDTTALVAWARAKTGASSTFRPPPNCADGIIQKCCVPAAEALMRRLSRSERAPSRGSVGASATSQPPSSPPTFGTTGDQTAGGRTSGSDRYPMQPDSSPSQTVVPPSSQGPTTSAAASASPRTTQVEVVPEVDGDNGAGAAGDVVRHEIPRDFLCPITLELMDEPVCVPGERHSYELSALREHLRVRGRFTKIGKQRFRLEGRPPIPGSHGQIVYDSYFTEYPPETLCGYLSRLVRGEGGTTEEEAEVQRLPQRRRGPPPGANVLRPHLALRKQIENYRNAQAEIEAEG